MPVYNAEKYVGEAIESVLNQTHSNIELIIVNDASTDNSKIIIQSYRDPRIKYFENAVNLNIVKTRNRCISEASGEYIAVLDSDDIARPLRLEKQLEFLEANKEFGMCGTFYQVIDSNGKLLNKVELPLSEIDTKTTLYFSNCFCHSSIMLRAELAKLFKYKEGYDIIEDYEIIYNISKVAKIGNLPFISTYYRIHGNNVTIEKKDEVLEKLLKMNKRILQDLNIDFSPEQLKMHTRFLAYDYDFFKNHDHFMPVESWILKLCSQLNNNAYLKSRLVENLFLARWFAICFNIRRFSNIFSLKLFSQFRWGYLQNLADKFTGREG